MLTTLEENVLIGDAVVDLVDNLSLPVGALLLIGSEVLALGTLSAGTTYNVTRGSSGTSAAAHTAGDAVYSVVAIRNTTDGIDVEYDNAGTVDTLTIVTVTGNVDLEFTAPTPLTDSSGGVADATLDPLPANLTDSSGGAADVTLDANPTALTDSSGGAADAIIDAVGATNAGDVSGAINDNFATLNAQLNATAVVLRDNIASLNAQLNARDVVLRDNIASLNAQVNALAAAVAAMTGVVT